jgi:protein involved in temperature-dependent protein secretion
VVKDTNSILHSDPNSVQARALLGRALKVLNDHKKAEEQLSVAILLDATQANLYIG